MMWRSDLFIKIYLE